jgi:DNA-binding winged helix-turn-helix (wHTH) protein
MGSPRNIVRFGEFAFDADTRQLLKGDNEIHLSPKAFELLLILVNNRPRAVSKADLQTELWPETFVSEANLPGLVKEIRRALHDDPRRPHVVRTLHGYGYAFAASEEGGPAEPVTGRREDVMFWLVADRQIRLAQGETILGRDPDATVWFDRPGVSRLHARITVTAEEARLEDLGSTNGTYLRGEKIDGPAALRDGDEIRLGPVTVTFRIRRAAASTEIFR